MQDAGAKEGLSPDEIVDAVQADVETDRSEYQKVRRTSPAAVYVCARYQRAPASSRAAEAGAGGREARRVARMTGRVVGSVVGARTHAQLMEVLDASSSLEQFLIMMKKKADRILKKKVRVGRGRRRFARVVDSVS